MITMLLAVTIHELGHMIASKAHGYGVSNIKIFLLSVTYLDNHMKISKNKEKITGQCLIYEKRPTGRKDACFAVLGGCIANCVLAAVFLILHFFITGKVLHALLFFNWTLNLYFAANNIIPSEENDGATFREILRYGAGNYNKLMNIASARERGLRYSEMNDEWFVPDTVGGAMARDICNLGFFRKLERENVRNVG